VHRSEGGYGSGEEFTLINSMKFGNCEYYTTKDAMKLAIPYVLYVEYIKY